MPEAFAAGGEDVASVDPKGILLASGESILFSDKLVKRVLHDTGIHADELQYLPPNRFEARGKINGVVYSTDAVRKLRYARTEELRQRHAGMVLAGFRKQQLLPDVVDDGPKGGETAIKMMEEQVAQLLAQEKKKAAEIARSRAERAKLDQGVELEAERLRAANAAKQAQVRVAPTCILAANLACVSDAEIVSARRSSRISRRRNSHSTRPCGCALRQHRPRAGYGQ
jgi:hypothetical protein